MAVCDSTTPKKINRRNFLKQLIRTLLTFIVLFFSWTKLFKVSGKMVWQIDPQKCLQCGRCTTHCVMTPSAVRCAHSFDLCGYCELCFGYFQPGAPKLNEEAAHQLCPTGAIERTFIEEPFYEYKIKNDLCIGCGKCVKGCTLFGNGSLHLQVMRDLCKNCNQCSIAVSCPGNAFYQIPINKSYIKKEK